MSLLHISASPRGERSESLAVARSFLDTFRSEHPDVPVETYDLWDGTLPAFGPDAAAAKMAIFAGERPVGAAAQAWQSAVDTFRRFDAADRYLFSVPMWNAGVPYVLKQFIDVISQPGLVFGFDPEQGYTGLLTGKRAELVPWFAGHRDVNALDLTGVDDHDLAVEAEKAAADSVMRVTRAAPDTDWRSPEAESPYVIEAFLEHKTVWHPKGA